MPYVNSTNYNNDNSSNERIISEIIESSLPNKFWLIYGGAF